jgi:hypothetical protein
VAHADHPPTGKPSPTGLDYAHTRQAEIRRAQKARLLASWCYDRGIGPGIGEADGEVQRVAARAAGVSPPHQNGAHSPTWTSVAHLLEQRALWDQRHERVPPPPAPCITCAVDPELCTHCRPLQLMLDDVADRAPQPERNPR